MQTILGSGGPIGTELAKALKQYTSEIRLVSRNPKKVNDTDELFPADVLNEAELRKAIQGSSVVYVTVGFPYNIKVWEKSWPLFMSYVISACREFNCKLVFFDNIYMYDPEYLNGMNEETPIRPVSKKGKVRAKVVKMIMDGIREGKLTALIARSADFYGPGIKNTSMLNETVIIPLSKGKTANWLGELNFKHNYTYTPDAGKATAILGNTGDAFNQVWHVPTSSADAMNGKELIEFIASEFHVKPKIQKVPKTMVRIMGIFMPIMKELVEMMYQYQRDYVFDSSKFEKRFNFKPVAMKDGVREVIKSDYKETGEIK